MTCNSSDHDCYPMYGPAPHECYWRKEGGFEKNPLGSSTILDVRKWPANFLAEIDPGEPVAEQISWGLCGVYYCPECLSGAAPSETLWTVEQVASALANPVEECVS